MKLVIEGEPVPKGRPRVNRKTGTFYTPRETQAWEKQIAYLAMAAKGKIEFEPVRFEAMFYTAKKKPADWDNLAKSLCDGLNTWAFTDDSQICEAHVVRVRSDRPRVEVSIEPCVERSELQGLGETT